MKKGCTIVFVLLVVIPLIIIIAATALIRAREAKWPEPMEGVRIEPLLTPLSADEITGTNAYFYLRKRGALTEREMPVEISAAVEAERDRYRDEGWKEGAFTNLLAHTRAELAPAMVLLEQAAATEFCQVEKLEFDGDYQGLSRILNDIKALCLLAHDHAMRGEWAEAEAKLLLGARISSTFSHGGSIISALVAGSGLDVVMMKIMEIDEAPGLPAETSVRLGREVAAARASMSPFAESLRHEWQLTRNLVTEVLRGGPRATAMTGTRIPKGAATAWRLWGSGPKRTPGNLQNLYSYLIGYADSGGKDRAAMQLVEDFLHDPHSSGPAMFISSDPLGRIFARLLVPALPVKREMELDVKADAVPVMLALRQFARAGGGTPPATLQELVPGRLERLPPDRYRADGGGLRYRVDGNEWCLYSVGPDGNDDGAEANGLNRKVRKQHPGKWDLVFRSDDFKRKRDKGKKESSH